MNNTIYGGTTTTPTPLVDLSNFYNKEEIDNKFGDVETALDTIIEIQNSLIGGDGV